MSLPPPVPPREHGGGVIAAARRHGGVPSDWLDLSTGINPVPWPVPALPPRVWTRLPEAEETAAAEAEARAFWAVPASHGVVAAPGASALIRLAPRLAPPGIADIPAPSYNEHRAAFRAEGWRIGRARARARVLVHPNNPDGRCWTAADLLPAPALTVVDESFADAVPGLALPHGAQLTLKSFGKFWGLAGLRLGFAIAPRPLAERLRALLGPWPVSGPALAIAGAALADRGWAEAARRRLASDALRLDALLARAGARPRGGTPLFRLVAVDDARAFADHLARAMILVRTFPYSAHLVRLGLPGDASAWARLGAALEGLR